MDWGRCGADLVLIREFELYVDSVRPQVPDGGLEEDLAVPLGCDRTGSGVVVSITRGGGEGTAAVLLQQFPIGPIQGFGR